MPNNQRISLPKPLLTPAGSGTDPQSIGRNIFSINEEERWHEYNPFTPTPKLRHYKKLTPAVPPHQEKLDEYRKAYWAFYDQLVQYKEQPTAAEAHRLSKKFDRLYSTQTGYAQLDNRIAKTLANIQALSRVLRHPELPLHNNEAELGARAQARARDVSLHTKSKVGTKAKDTFMSLVYTAKKLGVNVYDYFYDRISGKFTLPSLAQLIGEKSTPAAVT